MRATNAKMDFEAFGVRDIELSRLRLRGPRVKGVLRFGPKMAQKRPGLDRPGSYGHGKWAMITAPTRISALPLLRPAPASALPVITIIAILPL